MDTYEKLTEAKELFDNELLTESEYENIKKGLLLELSKDGSEPNEENVNDVKLFDINNCSNDDQPLPISTVVNTQKASIGMCILCFLIPLVGLIMFLINKDTKPVEAENELVAAGVGFVFGIIGYLFLLAL